MTKSKNDTRDRSGQDKWWWSRLVSFDSIVLSWSFLTIDSGGFSLVCFGDTLIRFEGDRFANLALHHKQNILLGLVWVLSGYQIYHQRATERWFWDVPGDLKPGSPVTKSPASFLRHQPQLPATAPLCNSFFFRHGSTWRFHYDQPALLPLLFCSQLKIFRWQSVTKKRTVRWPCDPAWRDLRLFIALLVHRYFCAPWKPRTCPGLSPCVWMTWKISTEMHRFVTSRFASKCWRSFNKDRINT